MKLYRTENRRRMLRILAQQSPCTAIQIHSLLQQQAEKNKVSSVHQCRRTLRQLSGGGIIKRQKQGNSYQYSRR